MKKRNFTLIEIMIVMLIIWFILYISIVYLLKFLQSVRNTERITNVKLLVSAMNIYFRNNLKYPLPDSFKDINFNSLNVTIFRQGVIGTWVVNYLKWISKVPIDVVFGRYKYSVNLSWSLYQIMIPLEDPKNKYYIEGFFRNFLVFPKDDRLYLLKLPSLFVYRSDSVYTGVWFYIYTGILYISVIKYQDITWYYNSWYDYSKLIILANYFNMDTDILDSILRTINWDVFFLDNQNVYPYNFNR